MAGVAVSVLMLSVVVPLTPAQPVAAFCEDRNDGSTCHTHMVESSLGFLRDGLLDRLSDAVLFPDDNGFLGLGYSSAEHFDSCNFKGGTKNINQRLAAALGGPLGSGAGFAPNTDPADPFAGITDWAAALHGAQDFYAHSNWIEMALEGIVPKVGLGGTELIDSGLGFWTEIDGSAFLVRPGIYHFNGDVPTGWTTSGGGTPLPTVTSVTGNSFSVLISGEVLDPTQDCPSDLDMDHDDLNKDNINRINHLEAQLVSVRQTSHEWCRLLNLASDELDHRTAAVLMGLMVEPGSSPHPPGTACESAAPGNVEVTVSIDAIRVLDDNNINGAGDLNFAFSLFTSDFRQSALVQTPTIAVNSGEEVPVGLLPPALTLSVDPNDGVVATIQGWEDDGASGELSSDDDVLAGVSRLIGSGADVANGAPLTLGSYTLTSDSSSTQDIEVDITITTPVADTDGDGVDDADDDFPSDPNRAVSCEPGFFGAFECIPAPAGTFVPTSGALAPTDCPIGFFSGVEAATQCTAAPIGSYVDSSGAVEATACPSGTSTETIASTSVSDCLPDFDGDGLPDTIDPDDDDDGVDDVDDLCPATELGDADRPEALKKNRFHANARGHFVGASGRDSGHDILDTGGCSARQIIDGAGLGVGHRRFGITAGAIDDWIASIA